MTYHEKHINLDQTNNCYAIYRMSSYKFFFMLQNTVTNYVYTRTVSMSGLSDHHIIYFKPGFFIVRGFEADMHDSFQIGIDFRRVMKFTQAHPSFFFFKRWQF